MQQHQEARARTRPAVRDQRTGPATQAAAASAWPAGEAWVLITRFRVITRSQPTCMLAARTRALLASIRQRLEEVTKRVLTTPASCARQRTRLEEGISADGRRQGGEAEEWSHDAQMRY